MKNPAPSIFHNIALSLGLLFLMASLSAQTVSSCSSLGLRPVTPFGDDLLAIYYDGNGAGLGGHGCWVHHHPNGKDYVITPHSWGRTPPTGKKSFIDAAMEALTDSRRTYKDYGSLNNGLYYILDDVNRSFPGEAFWLIRKSDQCWMQSGAPSLRWDNMAEKKQLMAHEIGHCFNMENVPNFTPDSYDMDWLDESVAEYLSAVVYPRTNREHGSAQNFDLDGGSFRQPYNAYPLIQAYLQRYRRPTSLVQLMRGVAGTNTDDSRRGYLRSKSMDEVLHHMYFEHYQSLMKDLGGGTIPREENVFPATDLFYFDPDSTVPFKPGDIPTEQLSMYELVLPSGYDVILDYGASTGKLPFLSIISESRKVRDWVGKVTVPGKCDGETTFKILASHLENAPLSGLVVNYTLQKRADCCTAVAANPSVEKFNGDFLFDYYMESEIVTVTEEGRLVQPLKYYVNSIDGSMLFSQGSFFASFGDDTGMGFILDAALMFPNGQLMAYVREKETGIKRAITLALNQTRADVNGVRAFKTREFLDQAIGSGIRPAALPTGSIWANRAQGHAYRQPDPQRPGTKTKISGYISQQGSVASSPLPSFGFMVGFMKDQHGRNKNLVYSKFEREDGTYIEANLLLLERQCFTFSGGKYKKMTLAGYTGGFETMTESQTDAFTETHEEYNEDFQELMVRLAACGDNAACARDVEKEMILLQRKREKSIYDLPKNPSYSGAAGSDFNAKQQTLRNDMLALADKMADKQYKCTRLRQSLSACSASGGACGPLINFSERCEAEYKSMEATMKKYDCEMAKLMGYEDAMDDCP
ncbi:hypothetical protein [Spongiimicrobium sp. 2-473A-2-J]|uniref:hypothetical protein n=1 Tax=Eudoraea algarum TaxID=3417568 RepID=UPI003D359F5B